MIESKGFINDEMIKPLTPNERIKLEVAEELGLLPLLLEKGWAGLPAKVTGRIGGIVRARLKAGG